MRIHQGHVRIQRGNVSFQRTSMTDTSEARCWKNTSTYKEVHDEVGRMQTSRNFALAFTVHETWSASAILSTRPHVLISEKFSISVMSHQPYCGWTAAVCGFTVWNGRPPREVMLLRIKLGNVRFHRGHVRIHSGQTRIHRGMKFRSKTPTLLPLLVFFQIFHMLRLKHK